MQSDQVPLPIKMTPERDCGEVAASVRESDVNAHDEFSDLRNVVNLLKPFPIQNSPIEGQRVLLVLCRELPRPHCSAGSLELSGTETVLLKEGAALIAELGVIV